MVVENAFTLVLPAEQGVTGLAQITSLVRRSDSISIKSEGTRVLVNVIKSLWSSDIPPAAAETEPLSIKQKKKQTAIRLMMTQDCASSLASLVARSGRYPVLVNEGVVALSLLSTQRLGGKTSLIVAAIVFSSPLSSSGPQGLVDIQPRGGIASVNGTVVDYIFHP